ncbi:hypothetical protein ACGFRG_00165 [Streptomyces sp. NPDC048696]|uniref:hypothetical protein n=1 Tax=Streptomyces sp. NPDC048696 TaxID=3365585 RepID=UPI003723BD05
MSSKQVAVKVAVPALAAIAVGAVAVGLSGNWPSHDGASSAGAASPAAAAAVPAAVGDPGNPATWKLPVEAYMVTKDQARLVGASRAAVITNCMKDAGFPQWTPAPDLPRVGGKTETDWRYGIHDAALAARRGYHPDAAEQKAYDKAMMAGAVDKSGADPQVVKRCVQSAGDLAARPADLVQQIKGDSYKASAEDPKVKAVFAQWSACMKAKGYSYGKPMDANNDPRFNDPDTVTDVEIATAKADIACRTQHHVEKTWFDAESALQTKAIKANASALAGIQSANKQAVTKAKALAATAR